MSTGPTRADVLIAGAATLVLYPLTVLVAITSLPAPQAWAVSVLALVAHGALAWRRSRPLASALLVGVAVGGEVAVTGLFYLLPSTLVLPMALYAAAAYAARWWLLVLGLVGSGVAAGRHAVDPDVVGSGFGPASWLLFLLFAAVLICSWTMGRLRGAQVVATRLAEERAEAERRDRMRSEELAAAQERGRISRDMHDVLAHSLSAIIGQARVARFDETRTVPALATIEETARASLHEIRGILRLLREGDAEARPQPGLADLPELVDRARSLGCAVTETTDGAPSAVSDAAQLAVYRFVQEAITNVTKHAHPGAAVDLALRWGADHLTVTVANDRLRTGRPARTDVGMGLTGMRERLVAVGGALVTTDPENAGGERFVVSATVPARAEERA
ncbi:sensor histidine kinase [Promicromonospora kroppenstedtii]|uniref:sensor histidine kinase n=1 Tax=Promicromonospora kroppenstedtii TaxID=440482 RepID=UPI0004B2793E|nr:histidine kinase [Promicromonospora kroppenstedtii]